MGNATSTTNGVDAPISPETPTLEKNIESSEIRPLKQLNPGDPTDTTTQRRNLRIYEATVDEQDVACSDEVPELSDKHKKFINHSLSHLFYGTNEKELTTPNLEFLLKRMKKQECKPGEVLVTQGEKHAENMYIVVEGLCQIHIDGKPVRQLKEGHLFGELSLILNVPRAATVTTITDSVVWLLGRHTFKIMQRMLASEVETIYASQFNNIPQLKEYLSEKDMNILVNLLAPVSFSNNEKLYTQFQISSNVMIIEEGSARIEHSKLNQPGVVDFNANEVTVEDLQKKYGIYGSTCTINGEKQHSVQIVPDTHNPKLQVITLYEGTIIVGPLWSLAGISDGWIWGLQMDAKDRGQSSKKKSKAGALPPFSIVAAEFVKCSYFTTGRFESKIDMAADVFCVSKRRERLTSAVAAESAPSPEARPTGTTVVVPGTIVYKRVFDEGTFSKTKFLSAIALGVVACGETKVDEKFPTPTVFFLKIISKGKAHKKHQVSIEIDMFLYFVFVFEC